MVQRLLDAGVPTTVYARRAEVREQFARAGAPVVATLPDAGRDADVVIVCVYSDTEVDEVALGGDGLIESMAPGAVLALHTTGSPATARRLAEAGAARGVKVVDAPVSGGADDILAGRLTVMLGGDPDDVARVSSVVAAYSDADLPHRRAGQRAGGQALEQRARSPPTSNWSRRPSAWPTSSASTRRPWRPSCSAAAARAT